MKRKATLLFECELAVNINIRRVRTEKRTKSRNYETKISNQCVLLLKNRRLFVIIIQSRQRIFVGFNAAPRMGAWIEIRRGSFGKIIYYAAPRMGAWIEIKNKPKTYRFWKPRPAWARGLKYLQILIILTGSIAAPRMGAWIEIIHT